MDITTLSNKYQVRRLQKNDLEEIYQLCKSNPLFYKYHPPFVTKETILKDMTILPEGKNYEDKFYIGFWDNKKLVAVMDLILDYPKDFIVFIGFFMVNIEYQGQGVGSEIIENSAKTLIAEGFKWIYLAIDKGNPQSEAFWCKNNFIKIGKVYPSDSSPYISMKRQLY